MSATPLSLLSVCFSSIALCCSVVASSGCNSTNDTIDATPMLDVPTPVDMGAPAPSFCGPSGFVDRRGEGTVDIGFGGELGSAPFGYSPACVIVTTGQSLHFVGGFNTHPLSPGTAPTDPTGSEGSPIVRTTSGAELTVSATSAGEFPYYCELHFAGGMRGIVRVTTP